MEIYNELLVYFSDAGATRRLVVLGAMLLGMSSGILGTFAVLRRQSLLGDAMAHAALPGICIAFLLTGEKNPLYLLLGATATGLLGAILIPWITSKTRIKTDAAMGIVLSVFFGLGIVLLTFIQQKGWASQAGLDHFLFGKAASLSQADIALIVSLCLLMLAFVGIFYKELKLLCFDPAFGAILGFSIRFFDYFLLFLIVLCVMIGLQAVGVVLMVAMLILPATAARQWTHRLHRMLFLAAFLGAISGITGAFCSTLAPKIPTGPVMVLAASFCLLVSLLCARQGLIPSLWRRRAYARRTRTNNILKTIYRIQEKKGLTGIEEKDLQEQLSVSSSQIRSLLKADLIHQDKERLHLTSAGLEKAKRILRNHRLWELYLQSEMNIAPDHVHRDAENIEDVLPAEIVRELDEVLHSPLVDQHGKPIPR